MQTHPQVDVLMLQSLNVQARALPQLDGYFYPPVTGVEGDRVMVATYVSTRLTYSPLVSPAGSVGCRLTTCAVAYLRREVTDRSPWSMFTTLLGAARSLRLLDSKTSTVRRAVGWWLAISTSATDCGMLLLLIRVVCTWQTQSFILTLYCSTMGQPRELASQRSAALP